MSAAAAGPVSEANKRGSAGPERPVSEANNSGSDTIGMRRLLASPRPV